MQTYRQRLLKWAPWFGPLHRIFHSSLEYAGRLPHFAREVVNHIRFKILWEARLRWISRGPRKHTLSKPVVHLYAVCWNESLIAPYFIDHYSKFVDAFFIYDNMSTDTTAALLSRYANVTVIPYDTGNTFNDAVNLEIKNNAWKQSRGKAEFVVVCDMDEFLYHPDMRSALHLLAKAGYTVATPHGYNMLSRSLPEFNGKQGITELIRTGIDAKRDYSKSILFSPELDDINFTPGSHKCSPKGRVKMFVSDRLKLLHYKHVDRDHVLAKMQAYRTRLSAINKKHGWGHHYEQPVEQVLLQFDQRILEGKTVI